MNVRERCDVISWLVLASWLSFLFCATSAQIHSLDSDKSTLSEEECATLNGSLALGAKIPLENCSELECILDNGIPVLVHKSCNPPANDLPNSCQIQVQHELQYPACCQVQVICEKIVPIALPLANSATKKSQMASNGTKNSIVEKMHSGIFINPLLPSGLITKSKEEDTPNLEIIGDELSNKQNLKVTGDEGSNTPKQKVIADEEGKTEKGVEVTSSTASHQEEAGCESEEFGLIRVGEEIDLKNNCAKVGCILSNGSPSLYTKRCDLVESDIPDNCSLLPPSDPKFPNCCQVLMVCKEWTTSVHPIVYTPFNISLMERNDLENIIDDSRVKISNPEIKDKKHQPFRSPQQPKFDHSAKDIESPLEANKGTDSALSAESAKSQSHEDKMCEFENEVLRVGEVRYDEDCSQLKCVSDDDSQFLEIRSCEVPKIPSREGCQIKTTQGHFPKCCETIEICEEISSSKVPTQYTHLNLSELQETNPTKPPLTFIHPQNLEEIDDPTPQEPYNNLPPPLRRTRRESLEPRKEEELEACLLMPGVYLKVNGSRPLRGCSRLTCVADVDSLALGVESCDPFSAVPPENCVIQTRSNVLYPGCCEVDILCEKVEKTVSPLIYTAANISKLQVNEDANSVYATSDLVKDYVSKDQNLPHTMDMSESKIYPITIQKDGQDKISETESLMKEKPSIKLSEIDIENSDVKATEKDVAQSDRDDVVFEGNKALTMIKENDDPNEEALEKDNSKPEIKVSSVHNIASNSKEVIAEKSIDTEIKISSQKDAKQKSETDPEKEKSTEKSPSVKPDTSTSSISMRIIERRRRNARTLKEPEAKPSFLLPLRSRFTSRNRPNSRYEDQQALELKDTMFITTAPKETTNEKIKDLEDKEKVSTNKIVKEQKIKRRGGLSALLSSRNLRATAPKESKKTEIEKSLPDVVVTNNDQKMEQKDSKLETKTNETTSRGYGVRSRNRSRNASDPARVAQRRRIYANRLNRFRAASSSDENIEESISVDENSKKKDQHSRKKKESKLSKKKDTKDKKDDKKTVGTKIPLRRRLNDKRRIKLVALNARRRKNDSDKKEEESKRLTIRKKGNNKEEKEKKEEVKEEEKEEKKVDSDKELSKTRFQRRRRKPSKTVTVVKEVKETSNRRKLKPAFNLKTLDITKESKKDETQVKKASDTTPAVSVEKTPKASNKKPTRTRATSRSRNLRLRLKEKLKKEKEVEKEEEQKEEPKTIKTEPEETIEIKKEVKEEPKVPETPLPSPKLISYPSKTDEPSESVNTEPPDYSYDPYYPYGPNYKSGLTDFDQLYSFPSEDDLELSSSDKEDAKTPNDEENEIPDVPEVPMKITTVSFTSSRRSFKTSKSRNSSKNFKETPPTYAVKETYKASEFR